MVGRRRERARGGKGREKEGRGQTALLQNTPDRGGSPERLYFPLGTLPKWAGEVGMHNPLVLVLINVTKRGSHLF